MGRPRHSNFNTRGMEAQKTNGADRSNLSSIIPKPEGQPDFEAVRATNPVRREITADLDVAVATPYRTR